MPRTHWVFHLAGALTLLATLAFCWTFRAHEGTMLVVGTLACVGFTLSWHLMVWGKRVHDIYVKALDYPYYILTGLGFFAAFSLAQEQHAHSKAKLRAQELAHVLLDVTAHCETDGADTASCQSFMQVVHQFDLEHAQFSLEALQTSQLFENQTMLDLMPELAALAPEFIDLTTHAVQVAHEDAHRAAEQKVQFETFWPFMLAFAFSIKLVKTSLELRRFRRKYMSSHADA